MCIICPLQSLHPCPALCRRFREASCNGQAKVRCRNPGKSRRAETVSRRLLRTCTDIVHEESCECLYWQYQSHGTFFLYTFFLHESLIVCLFNCLLGCARACVRVCVRALIRLAPTRPFIFPFFLSFFFISFFYLLGQVLIWSIA